MGRNSNGFIDLLKYELLHVLEIPLIDNHVYGKNSTLLTPECQRGTICSNSSLTIKVALF